jgi:hypothetical protein
VALGDVRDLVGDQLDAVVRRRIVRTRGKVDILAGGEGASPDRRARQRGARVVVDSDPT